MAEGGRTESQRWGRRVLLILLGAFALVIGINVVMVTLAMRTFSGTTSVNPYEQGLAYNHTLETKHKQDALGWNAVRIRDDFPKTLGYMVAGANGEPLGGAKVTALLTRPVGTAVGTSVTLLETKPGVYEAEVTWPGEGRWDVTTEISKGDSVFSMRERVMVR